jgi:hypothetical protein
MGWETRGNRRYYYYKHRCGDKILSLYLGTGRAAELFEQLGESQRFEAAMEREAKRKRRKAERERIAEQETPIIEYCKYVDYLFHQAMEAAGYYQHHRQWRRRSLITMRKPAEHFYLPSLITPKLKEQLACKQLSKDDGTLADAWGGDLAEIALSSLVDEITSDPHQRAALRRKVELITEELAAPKPTPLAKHLARRVALCWLVVHAADIRSFATLDWLALDSSIVDRFDRRQGRAHGMYLSACKALAACQRLALP